MNQTSSGLTKKISDQCLWFSLKESTDTINICNCDNVLTQNGEEIIKIKTLYTKIINPVLPDFTINFIMTPFPVTAKRGHLSNN